MNGNYGWQEFAAKERSRGHRHQAEAHRQAKSVKDNSKVEGSLFGKVSFAFIMSAFIVVIGFLLNGCHLADVSIADASSVFRPSRRVKAANFFQQQGERHLDEKLAAFR